MIGFVRPDWPAPAGALVTTREGGASVGAHASLNLGLRSGDDEAAVRENRRRLEALLPSPPVWLRQVHGIGVADADAARAEGGQPEADAAVARRPGTVCAVLVADCMPVLLADESAQVVAAAHAGWRGLCGGVLEAAVDAMRVDPRGLIAWLGPAIGRGPTKSATKCAKPLLRATRRRPGRFAPRARATGCSTCTPLRASASRRKA